MQMLGEWAVPQVGALIGAGAPCRPTARRCSDRPKRDGLPRTSRLVNVLLSKVSEVAGLVEGAKNGARDRAPVVPGGGVGLVGRVTALELPGRRRSGGHPPHRRQAGGPYSFVGFSCLARSRKYLALFRQT